MVGMPPSTSMYPGRQYAAPTGQHVSLGGPLRGILWFLVTLVVAIVLFTSTPETQQAKGTAWVILILFAVVWGIIVNGLRVAAQWERGVVLRLGSLHGVRGPGVIYIVPFIDYIRFVDTRTLVLNIPSQKVITRDNVPAQVDGALFFLITDAARAVTSVQEYQFAIAQYAQAALRDVVGRMTLDEMLTEREQIQQNIAENVEEHIKEWGLHVDSIRLLDIELPEELKRMMSRQASAEREKRATITKAEGDKEAAVNLAKAAEIMQTHNGAMLLRSLQTIDGLGPSASNTVVLFPVEWVVAARAAANKMNSEGPGEEKPDSNA